MKSRNHLSMATLFAGSLRSVPFLCPARRSSLLRLVGAIALLSLLAQAPVLAQCELACKQYAPVYLDDQGEATITEADVLNNYPDPDCPGLILVTVTTMQGAQVGMNVDCAYAGDTLMISATHAGSGNSCWGSVVITDSLAPQLVCQDAFVYCSDTLLADSIGYPAWDENCTTLDESDFTFSDQYVNLPCSTLVNAQLVTGRVDRTWSVADSAGNTASCLQTIWLRTADVADIVFPEDRDGIAAPFLLCGDSPKNLAVTGQPTIDGFPIHSLGFCELTVDTFDQVIPGCQGGAYRTVRTWRIIDYCQDTTIYHVQDIHLVDNIAPTIQAPADITVGTSAKTCDAPVILPVNWTASDTCSAFSVQISWAFGSGTGPFLKVPQGVYPVSYTAIDACGNASTDTMYVTVADVVKPTAVCKKDVNIALPSSGIITVPASLFDDGSYDNCLLDHLDVSRDNKPFAPMATFNCNDIGKNIMVILRATDAVGLTNTCMMIVLIQDKLAPDIACPDDITVACNFDIKNLAVTGVAIGTDNCQMKSVTYQDTKFLNQCQVGTVNRLWTAEDIQGNKSGCLQVITKVDSTPIQIVWPVNFSSSVCGQSIDPAITGQPAISGWDCENLFVTYTDKEYKTAYPACYRIERCWEVRDWCTFNANQNPNPGLWQFVQYIDIFDHDAPVLQIPADLTVGTSDIYCHADLNIPPATANDCNPNTLISNNSPYANGKGASINGLYPVGVHMIMFTATDGCGNSSMATMKLTVIDNKPPLAICNNGVSIGLNMNGVAILPVSLIDNNSRDNCTPFSGLSFNLYPFEFSCDSLGQHQVTLTVTDASGNSNHCTTIVVVQDNLGICPSGSKPEISGKVMTSSGQPLTGIDVWLNGADPVKTDANGQFLFQGIDAGTHCTIAPEWDVQPLNGVSVADLIALQKHILGQKPLTDPLLLLAGDVTSNGIISIADIVEIRKLLLGYLPAFQQVPSWQFVKADYTFKNPLKPAVEPFPQEILIENIQVNWNGQDFTAVKMGDINQSAKTNQLHEGEVRQAPLATLWMTDQVLQPGYVYEIPVQVRSERALTGMQWDLTLTTSDAELLDAQPAPGTLLTREMIRVASGKMRVVWHHAVPDDGLAQNDFVILHLRVNREMPLSDLLALPDTPSAEVVDAFDGTGSIDLRFSEPLDYNVVVQDPAWPNPFRDVTHFRFQLEEDGPVVIRVLDILGREVWHHQAPYTAGPHTVTIPGSELGRSGTYHLQIQTPHTRPVSQLLVLTDE